MDIEYTICLIQSGDISLAAKTHRRLGGNPRLSVSITATHVEWRLQNLIDGTPETIVDMPRQNHIDFYFLYKDKSSILSQLPTPTVSANSDLSLPPVSSQGYERPGGKRVRIVAPVRRFLVSSVDLYVNHAPPFYAVGIEPYMHIDVENTPADLYGEETFEIHFGIQAEFNIEDTYSGHENYGLVKMPFDTYATIYRELSFL
ncbi:hypothetical protein ACFLVG_04980 [Chloroflexota bacterium]